MNLKITVIQADLHWENVTENLTSFLKKIKAVAEQTDIVVLPEMFNTGFSMDSEKLAETMSGVTVTWMKEHSEKENVVIVGSLIVKVCSLSGAEEKINYYNRLIWVQPDGKIFTYDKRHLFRMANEHEHFTAGTERLIVEYKGWKICPLVCYDLRFPVWSRNTPPVYDVLIYIANWPEVRKQPWSKLLEARAIENQCYVVGVNRVGTDGTGKTYSGNSVVINSKGEAITTIPESENHIVTVSLSLDELTAFRKAFPVALDGDDFSVS